MGDGFGKPSTQHTPVFARTVVPIPRLSYLSIERPTGPRGPAVQAMEPALFSRFRQEGWSLNEQVMGQRRASCGLCQGAWIAREHAGDGSASAAAASSTEARKTPALLRVLAALLVKPAGYGRLPGSRVRRRRRPQLPAGAADAAERRSEAGKCRLFLLLKGGGTGGVFVWRISCSRLGWPSDPGQQAAQGPRPAGRCPAQAPPQLCLGLTPPCPAAGRCLPARGHRPGRLQEGGGAAGAASQVWVGGWCVCVWCVGWWWCVCAHTHTTWCGGRRRAAVYEQLRLPSCPALLAPSLLPSPLLGLGVQGVQRLGNQSAAPCPVPCPACSPAMQRGARRVSALLRCRRRRRRAARPHPAPAAHRRSGQLRGGGAAAAGGHGGAGGRGVCACGGGCVCVWWVGGGTVCAFMRLGVCVHAAGCVCARAFVWEMCACETVCA